MLDLAPLALPALCLSSWALIILILILGLRLEPLLPHPLRSLNTGLMPYSQGQAAPIAACRCELLSSRLLGKMSFHVSCAQPWPFDTGSGLSCLFSSCLESSGLSLWSDVQTITKARSMSANIKGMKQWKEHLKENVGRQFLANWGKV